MNPYLLESGSCAAALGVITCLGETWWVCGKMLQHYFVTLASAYQHHAFGSEARSATFSRRRHAHVGWDQHRADGTAASPHQGTQLSLIHI